MYPDNRIYGGFTSCNFDLWWKQNGGSDNDLRKKTWLQFDYLCQDCFDSEILPRSFCLCAEFAAKHTKAPIIAHNVLENGAWFWLMTDARYIVLPLISRYHCLDPTNHDISRVHCIYIFQYSSWCNLVMWLISNSLPCCHGDQVETGVPLHVTVATWWPRQSGTLSHLGHKTV